MNFLQMPSTHMTHTEEASNSNFSDILFGASLMVIFFLILSIIVIFFVFKDQVREKLVKKTEYETTSNIVNSIEKSNENNPESNNQTIESEFIIDKNYITSYSIDEQAYQKERLMNLINNYPEGILQSKLPNLTNLSKATISRRIGELVEKNLIMREPRGRSILIIPKN